MVSLEFPFNFVAGTAKPFRVVAQDGVTTRDYQSSISRSGNEEVSAFCDVFVGRQSFDCATEKKHYPAQDL